MSVLHTQPNEPMIYEEHSIYNATVISNMNRIYHERYYAADCMSFVNPITVDNYAFLFYCMAAVRTSESMMVLS